MEPAVVPQVLLVEVRVRLVLVKDDNDDNGDDSDSDFEYKETCNTAGLYFLALRRISSTWRLQMQMFSCKCKSTAIAKTSEKIF